MVSGPSACAISRSISDSCTRDYFFGLSSSHFAARRRCSEIATASGGRMRICMARTTGKISSRVVSFPKNSMLRRRRASLDPFLFVARFRGSPFPHSPIRPGARRTSARSSAHSRLGAHYRPVRSGTPLDGHPNDACASHWLWQVRWPLRGLRDEPQEQIMAHVFRGALPGTVAMVHQEAVTADS